MEERFGERLKELRVKRRIGQVEFAKEIGVTKSAISPWEMRVSQACTI